MRCFLQIIMKQDQYVLTGHARVCEIVHKVASQLVCILICHFAFLFLLFDIEATTRQLTGNVKGAIA
jgi:chemotaxis regulatin CheY-phosphate phosphatase CheZ